MSLPQQIVDKFKPLAEGARFWGQPIDEFNRDELLAVIGYMRRYQQTVYESIEKEREMMRDVRHSLFGRS